MLAREGEPYPVLRLTPAGISVLKGSGDCPLYREVVPPKAKGKRRMRLAQGIGVDPGLFDVLRNVRLRLARERGVPPYVIFHDRTLQEMADRRPSTLDDLYDIYGVGVRKAADFGDAFLDAIRTFRKAEV
jgi:ATP-dependent DNA helicase RecQ